MKTVVEINSTNYASTGNISLNIASLARKKGYRVFTACKNAKESQKYRYPDQIYIGTRIERIISEKLAYYTGLRGHFNLIGTYRFLKELDKIKPDIIHLHVLHDTFINLNMLFKYISKNHIPVIWTFHDCWSLTGQCPYFDIVECEKWINGCHNCEQIHVDPKSFILDTSSFMWKKKKKMFTMPEDMKIVTCSKWLKGLSEKSFFKKYPVMVINNGINLERFRYMENSFKKDMGIEDKYLVLGVSNFWGYRKGLDVFVKLAEELPDNYQIVLVGTNDAIDKTLPKNIISIHRTYNQEELVKIYSAADIFVNPTREENFPTVNIESIACGTPVITYDTGGSAEIIDEKCGMKVKRNDYKALKEGIINICNDKRFSKEDCINHARCFDMNSSFEKYIELYDEILKEK